MTSRIATALLGLWFALCTVTACRHEAEVAHATDASGRVVHAQVLSGHHEGPSDVHAPTPADHDECTILAAMHQATRTSPPVVIAAPLHTLHVAPALPVASAREPASLYRLAPKTSPPDRTT